MPIPARPIFDSSDRRWRIRITDDDSPTLVQVSTDDAMHSGCGAVAETEHVYLRGSGVAERLADSVPTRVLEVGFGCGMGWLLTADAALASGAPLFYLGLENLLPPALVVRQLDLGRYVHRRDLLDAYCRWLECVPRYGDAPAAESTTVTFEFERLSLQIEMGDAVAWCRRVREGLVEPPARFDAVYFDPYSPETSPQLWQREIFAALVAVLSDSGSLVSYCVNRPVRDAIEAAGLLVSKVPGPVGGKREVLVARKPSLSTT